MPKSKEDITVLVTFRCFPRVDEKLRLKVTDNGLARDLFPDDYHCLGDNENRPVKWMAPEALLHYQYSTSADVVSLTWLQIMLLLKKLFKLNKTIFKKIWI